MHILVSLGGQPLTLAQGPADPEIPRCNRFPLRRECTCSAPQKDGEEDDRLVETKHESRGKLEKTAPPLPSQARLLSKHCTFHPRGLESRGGGGGGGATSCFSRRRILHKHRVRGECRGSSLEPYCGHGASHTGSSAVSLLATSHSLSTGHGTRACECSLSL